MPLFIIFSLILIVAFVTVFRVLDLEPYSIPVAAPKISEKRILFDFGENDETLILSSKGEVLVSYSSEQSNFVSTVTKVLKRERKKVGIEENAKVLLRRDENNRLSIYDPETKREIDLAGFGESNLEIFYDLLK
jgi:putative photosynthetic complex assembly protein